MTGTGHLTIESRPDSDGEATISWSGGIPPFQLQKTFDFQNWENVGKPTLARSRIVLTTEHPHAFFRLQEGVMLLDIDLEYLEGTKLVWDVPELE